MKSKISKIRENLYIYAFTLKMAYDISYKYLIFLILYSISWSILKILSSYNLTIILFSIKNNNINNTYIIIIIFAALKLVFLNLSNFFRNIEEINRNIVIKQIYEKLFNHLTLIPYWYLEDSSFLDLLSKTKQAIVSEECLDTVFKNTINLLEKIFVIITLILILTKLNLLYFLIIIILFLISGFINNKKKKEDVIFFNDNVLVNRRFFYYSETLQNHFFGKDFRIFKIGNLMLNKFSRFSSEMINMYSKYLHKYNCLDSVNEIVILLAKICLLLIAFNNSNEISIVSASYLIETILSYFTNITDMHSIVKKLFYGLSLSSSLKEIFEINEEKTTGEISVDFNRLELEIKNVSFSYPKSERLILKNINLKINKGDRVCLIGENGSGKSTLIKLISRLYKPNCGEILLNGISIYDYNDSYSDFLGVMFQDYEIYSIKIKDYFINLNQSERDNVYKLVNLNEKIMQLANKEEEYVGTIFNNGIGLSGGEYQRLNLARILSKKSPIIILDEPTSSIDAKGENEFYKIIDDLDCQNTVIFVSHRMSSAKSSNRIIEIANGTIYNDSNMSKLLETENSIFRKLFNAQKEKYK